MTHGMRYVSLTLSSLLSSEACASPHVSKRQRDERGRGLFGREGRERRGAAAMGGPYRDSGLRTFLRILMVGCSQKRF